MILISKNYICLSIRTPILLLTNNLSWFLIIIFNIKFFKSIFLSFSQIWLFLLRFQKRIITCCGIKNDEREDIKLFYDKRYLFQEIYYVKLMLKCLLIVLLI